MWARVDLCKVRKSAPKAAHDGGSRCGVDLRCHGVRAVVDRAAEERMLGLLAERARKFQQEKEEVGG